MFKSAIFSIKVYLRELFGSAHKEGSDAVSKKQLTGVRWAVEQMFSNSVLFCLVTTPLTVAVCWFGFGRLYDWLLLSLPPQTPGGLAVVKIVLACIFVGAWFWFMGAVKKFIRY
jgi:hypothetical protein